MDLKNIKRNKLDYLLTDILPTELSDRFTYSYFYEYLEKNYKDISKMIKLLEHTKANSQECLFLAKAWASMPLKYSIMKDLHSVREISLVQPLAAIEILMFVELYQKELLNLLEKNSYFSLRYHHKNNELCYKNKNKSVTKYFDKECKMAGREIIEQTGMFFNIAPYKSIPEFTCSEEWHILNSKYSYFVTTDYKSCFDSIYTHTYTWVIGKDSIDTKGFAHNSNIYSVIDRVLQNINARRSNGIVVGPEFSRMIAEIILQNIDVAVYNKLFNSGKICGQDYNVYRYVDDIFIFTNSEALAMRIVDEYVEIAQKYLLRLNESKLFCSKVPFVLNGWLNETNLFTNRVCDRLFTSTEQQKEYIKYMVSIGAKEGEIKGYLLKSRIIRYGSSAKQSIMNQLNELICKYESKTKTIVSYFLSTILNHIGKNKGKTTVFSSKISASTVFSFLDLVFYAYSFLPNFSNTEKLLAIISYVRDEYDILGHKQELQKIINRYAFIFDKANPNDIVNLLLFYAQAGLEITYVQEERIFLKLKEKNDPILWGTYWLYTQYNQKYFKEVKHEIEGLIEKNIAAIIVTKSIYEYREFWWLIIFNKCPFIDTKIQEQIGNIIKQLSRTKNDKSCTDIMIRIFFEYLINNDEQFFEWDLHKRDFLRTLTFRTHEKSIFKNYGGNLASWEWGSI